MAGRARVRDFELFGEGWRDKSEGVAADEIVRQRLLYFGHVTGEAIAARAAGAMVGMSFDCRGMRPIR